MGKNLLCGRLQNWAGRLGRIGVPLRTHSRKGRCAKWFEDVTDGETIGDPVMGAEEGLRLWGSARVRVGERGEARRGEAR